MSCQMIRVISSPSISTTVPVTLIFCMESSLQSRQRQSAALLALGRAQAKVAGAAGGQQLSTAPGLLGTVGAAQERAPHMRLNAVHINGIDLCLRAVGDASAPLVLFLHGFPEYSAAWDEVLPAFADRFHAVAPDQRGYARSGKPKDLEAYRIKHLVRDILGLGEQLSPARPFSLVAHDWGASVAYATAIAAPRRVARQIGRAHV